MLLRVVTASTGGAVPLTEAKEYLRTITDAELPTMKRQLTAATQFCERRISGHRQFCKTVYNGYLREFPGNDGRITFPLPPLYSSTGIAITYYDTDNASQTLASTIYDIVVPTDAPAFIEPKQSEAWPSTRLRPDAVTVQFEAGYGGQTDVPAALKEAVLMKLEHLWDPGRFPKPEAVDGAVQAMLDTFDYGHYG